MKKNAFDKSKENAKIKYTVCTHCRRCDQSITKAGREINWLIDTSTGAMSLFVNSAMKSTWWDRAWPGLKSDDFLYNGNLTTYIHTVSLITSIICWVKLWAIEHRSLSLSLSQSAVNLTHFLRMREVHSRLVYLSEFITIYSIILYRPPEWTGILFYECPRNECIDFLSLYIDVLFSLTGPVFTWFVWAVRVGGIPPWPVNPLIPFESVERCDKHSKNPVMSV